MIAASAEDASTKDAIPLIARGDLHWQRISYQGDGTWTVKDPVGLQYHRLTDAERELLLLLDGEASVEAIRKEMNRRFPMRHTTASDIQRRVISLHEKRLTVSARPLQGRALFKARRKKRLQKIKQTLMSALFIRLPSWDPTNILGLLYPFVRWAFRPVVVIASLFVVAAAYIWLLTQFAEFQRQLPTFSQFFSWPNLIYLWIVMSVIKVCHEFGHGLTCVHHGAECHGMGVMLLVFSPTLYCDVTDSWMLRSKWQRMAIGAAGMYVEALLSVVALAVWWNTHDGLIHYLALNTFFITSVGTTLFNANPLMRLDGYYILSDYLEMPNLRQKAGQYLKDVFGEYALGITIEQDDPFAPQRHRFWFAVYAVASSIYKFVLMAVIGGFLWTYLKPYGLEVLGGLVIATSIIGMLSQTGWSIWKMIKQPRETPWNKPRFAISVAVLVAIMTGVSLIPFPVYIEAPFTVQAEGERQVFTSIDGTLEQVFVEPGDIVQKGDLLAVLSNDGKEDERRELRHQLDIQTTRVDTYQATQRYAELALATEQVASLNAQLAALEKQFENLEIRSREAGHVVAPQMTPETPIDALDGALPQWHGSPLDPENVGAFLPAQTHLLTIAPSERMEITLLIDQTDRNDVAEQQTVRIVFDHAPETVYEGQITRVSLRQTDTAPGLLSANAGGSLATVADPQGRETLLSVAYEATVRLPDDLPFLLTDLRGRARCVVAKRSLAELTYRWIRENISVAM